MTLNEWEQSNIEVLTSREMGEWLSRRENRLLERIQAEIEKVFCMSVVTNELRTPMEVKTEILQIIEKYR